MRFLHSFKVPPYKIFVNGTKVEKPGRHHLDQVIKTNNLVMGQIDITCIWQDTIKKI